LSIEALMREPQAQLKSDTPGAAGVMKAAELAGMPAEAARLAGQQLQILEGEPFLWQGLAWPGQTMQWLIREETDGSHSSAETDPFAAEWSTELNLTLPRIGEVHAQLGLNGDRIRLRLQAADTSTCAALEAALPLLAHALQANGLKPVEMQVNVQAEVAHGAA
jgi:flagellar hook-length control protein FliK